MIATGFAHHRIATWIFFSLVMAAGISPTVADDFYPIVAELDDETVAVTDVPLLDESFRSQIADLESRLKELEENQKRSKSSGLPTATLTGQVQSDFVWFDQSEANRQAVGPLEQGVMIRRARLGVFGDFHELVVYRIEMDFALAGRPTFLDNWVGVHDVPNIGSVRVGHFFEPFSLERLTPNRFMTFMERSVVDQFSPVRNTGIMAWHDALDGDLTWATGIFRNDSDAFGNDVGDRNEWASTSRVTVSPFFDNTRRHYLLHLGASYSIRGADESQVRFAGVPEIRAEGAGEGSLPPFVDTGVIEARHHQLFGAEVAVVRESLSIQSEVVYAPVSRIDGPDVAFHGVYVFGSYFLTGESRQYYRRKAPFLQNNGIFDRVTPKTNVFCGPNSGGQCNPGIGAWEIAARWSHLDLNSNDIRGGRLNSVTFGLNWYLNPYARVQWNYIKPILDDPDLGQSSADIYAMRVGFDF